VKFEYCLQYPWGVRVDEIREDVQSRLNQAQLTAVLMQISPKLLEHLGDREIATFGKLVTEPVQCKKRRIQLSRPKIASPSLIFFLINLSRISAVYCLLKDKVDNWPKPLGIFWGGIADPADRLEGKIDQVLIVALQEKKQVGKERFFHCRLEKMAIDPTKTTEKFEELHDQDWLVNVAEPAR
jgi:hypothetical protein